MFKLETPADFREILSPFMDRTGIYIRFFRYQSRKLITGNKHNRNV
jgi:hypothetical protein